MDPHPALEDRIAEDIVSIPPLFHKTFLCSDSRVTATLASQYRMLMILERDGPLPMSELGKRLFVSKPYITLLVDRVLKDGFVERHQDEKDRRMIRVVLTRHGAEYLREIRSLLKEVARTRLAGLDAGDLWVLCISIENVRTILAKIQ
ncbi:MAG: MarR family transcriptional regulator [Methanobacteriota archaeon]|nr:MAG: MarR family transcriptional regulator [Euryarchaeota archaeon]